MQIPIFKMVRALLSIIIYMYLSPALASNHRLICPDKVAASHLQFNYSDDDWVPFVESHLKLTSVGFMQAPPEKVAHLKPFTSSKYKKNDTDNWRFEGDYPEGKWITCSYDQGTASLSKKIDNKFSECAVTTVIKRKYADKQFEIRCK